MHRHTHAITSSYTTIQIHARTQIHTHMHIHTYIHKAFPWERWDLALEEPHFLACCEHWQFPLHGIFLEAHLVVVFIVLHGEPELVLGKHVLCEFLLELLTNSHAQSIIYPILYIIYYALYVVYYMLCVINSMLYVICDMLCVI